MGTNEAGTYEPKSLAKTQQPGALAATAPGSETAGMVLAAQAKALVEARYTIALRQPRDLDVVEQRLMKECERPAFAEAAIYHKPIGDGIEGPSIRLAEACVQLMGNILIDSPAIYDDAEKRIVRVSVADMETNVAYSQDVTVTKTVERRFLKDGDEVIRQRVNKDNKAIYVRRATDDEIANTQGALVSKAIRTLALRVVPGWLVDQAMTKCYAVRKSGGTDPRAAKQRLFTAFENVGVKVEQVKEWLGHDGELIQPAERETLLGIYNAIKDGETTWRDVMEARLIEREKGEKKGAGAKATAPAAATPPTPAAAAPSVTPPQAAPAPQAQPEQPPQGFEPAPESTPPAPEPSPVQGASPAEVAQTIQGAQAAGKRGAAAVKAAIKQQQPQTPPEQGGIDFNK